MRLTIVDAERCIGCQVCMFACVRRQGEAGLAGTCIEVKSVGGMERGFIVVVCRACNDAPCAKVCPTEALSPRKGGGVTLDPAKCIGCGNCRDACIIGAVHWDPASGESIERVLHRADCAMYEEKRKTSSG